MLRKMLELFPLLCYNNIEIDGVIAMKRSEATPELLKVLEDPENIYTFEEDEIEMCLVFSYLRCYKKWSGDLTDEQRNEVGLFLEKGLKVIAKRIEFGLLKDTIFEIRAFLEKTAIEDILKMYDEYFNEDGNYLRVGSSQ